MSDKVYFASDFHLGTNGRLSSKDREKQIVRWLDMIKEDATAVFLVGDLFDFWFEYSQAIPKGYHRFFGKLAEMVDQGIEVVFFTGNHDMWMFSYFTEEMGIPVHRNPIERILGGKKFFIGHGDGLGPGDHGYKMIKKVFSNRLCQWAFARIHPNLGLRIMKFWSGRSRESTDMEPGFLGAEKEWLVQYCEEKIKAEQIDYFIFGHRHLPIVYNLSNGISKYINLGDWLNYNSYAVFDGQELTYRFFENDGVIHPK